MKKVILINGPTASGKSRYAIDLANKINGEIISVDSRQIFKEIPYFSGVVFPEEMNGVKHYFVGELSLVKGDEFNISDFQKKVFQKIDEILERKKTPILVGGSSFFFETVVYKNFLPEVEPDLELRKELEKKNNQELFGEILEKDKKTAERIDKNNKARLLRAVEIIRKIGRVPELKKELNSKYSFEEILILREKEEIKKRIEENFLKRVDKMLEEAEILAGRNIDQNTISPTKRSKISPEKFKQLGLAYKNIFDFWNERISKDEFIELGIREEQKYAKRQITYLKKFFENLPKEVEKNKILF